MCCDADDLTGADWWNWWGDVDDAAAAQLPDTPSTSSSLGGCGSDGVPDSPPLTLGPSSAAAAAAGLPHELPWSATADKLFPIELTNRQSSYVPRDLLLCMTSRTAADADGSPFVY